MTRNPFRRRSIIRHQIPSRSFIPVAAALVSVLALFILVGCDYEPPEITGLGADSAFVLAVIPVLKDQCDDCHFPGGPMHKRMPFDDMEVVGSLEDEVVIRLGGKGRERVAQWLVVWKREQEAANTPGRGQE